jgi:diguanylate cyclase (GGDEF)-like protein
MRIHHHVSILLVVAVLGAVALAGAVGLCLAGTEREVREVQVAAETCERVEEIVADSRALLQVIDWLTPDSSDENLAFVGRDLERCAAALGRLRLRARDDTTLQEARDALGELAERRDVLAAGRAAGFQDGEAFRSLRDGAAEFRIRLERLRGEAARTASDLEQSLARGRRIVMLIIGLLVVLYLAAIERVRVWTARRLVHPVQKLAAAAVKAVEQGDMPAVLDRGTTGELQEMSRALSSLVEAINARVEQRMTRVERQKERLEREVALRRRAEDQLRHAALHDRLTGLCNRQLLLDRIERCLARSRRHPDYHFAVLFLDIDGFKEVNDSLGHQAGDHLLVEISQRLQQCLRATDSLTWVESNTVARIGGDEFVVLLDGIQQRGDASLVAERVQQALAPPCRVLDRDVALTASIGIAFNELDCGRADQLLRDADIAMYHAKSSGKARHEVFHERMHQETTDRLRLRDELRRAVERAEFEIVYQPIVGLASGRLASFEAFPQWRHPEGGIISPREFIGHAEETGVIVPLGKWVVREVCRQVRAWRDSGGPPDFSVSVNVSKREVGEPDLIETVQQALAEHGLEGTHLNLEVTEGVFLDGAEAAAEALRRLRELGVCIHLDDFGTGYSPLAYLHRMPLDALKIDRTYLSALGSEGDGTAAVRSVVALAHALRLRVTVEGVETSEDMTQLRALECDYAQGYYFAGPLSAQEAQHLISSDRNWLRPAA